MFRNNEVLAKHYPEIVFVEITNRCNLRCVMCPHPNMKRQMGEMSFEEFKIIADNVEEFGVENTRMNMYFFGETFLHSEAVSMIRYAKDIGLRVELSTNVVSLNEKVICELIKLLDYRDTFLLSLDGYDKEEYELIRFGAKYDKMFENFRHIIREHSKSKNKPILILQSVYNWIPKKFGESGLISENENPNFVNKFLEKFIKETWEIIGKEFEHNEVLSFIKNYKENYKQGRLRDTISDSVVVYVKTVDNWAGQMSDNYGEIGTHQKDCDFPWRTMIVQWNGDVTVCCKDLDGKINVGNAFDESLYKIWNSNKMKGLRKDFINFKNNGICRYCGVSNQKTYKSYNNSEEKKVKIYTLKDYDKNDFGPLFYLMDNCGDPSLSIVKNKHIISIFYYDEEKREWSENNKTIIICDEKFNVIVKDMTSNGILLNNIPLQDLVNIPQSVFDKASYIELSDPKKRNLEPEITKLKKGE